MSGKPDDQTSSPGLASAAAGLRHVFLRDMLLQARIGVEAHEQRGAQRVRINVDLGVRDEGGIGRDEIGRVVDYAAVAARVRAIVAGGHVKLVETLAERIADAVLAADPRIRLARVRVEKLDVFADALSAGVEVERAQRG